MKYISASIKADCSCKITFVIQDEVSRKYFDGTFTRSSYKLEII